MALRWCPVVRRDFAVLDGSAGAPALSEAALGAGAQLRDEARDRKLRAMLSKGEGFGQGSHIRA